ncbi:mannose-6-phosphate isomerase, class I [Corynebacterium sp.]|uniref:mannose-6-phosphate isomerase, class I n=1 Tax=Corynebacterium sp. TaxID=1720 RepID=UPI0026DBB732|nr:mannose-6-phosphate isomerase, class I [Corynebacterium sp.]MDO4610200.1 mannose-6-phosphate isomerase, class I [Corynebacterium sp.]
MQPLEGVVQSYPWGSRTLLAELRGEESPSPRPQAEIWFGAHPLGPSTVGGRPLPDVIADDPAGQVGEADGQLPFLLKLLAADAPLSLQAHPTREQAERGYAAEDEAGVAVTAPDRNYRDPNHKPELLVALTEFHALAGFRPLDRTRELFAELDIPELGRYLVLLDAGTPEEGLRSLFTTLLTLPSGVLGDLVDAVARACAAYDGGGWIGQVAATTADIALRYPGDPGVLASMLLNRITLQPGEAVYLGARQLHAYLSGMGVEIMANSDNVLRGGLTSKHVDVVELLRVLEFAPLDDPVVRPRTDGADPRVRRWDVPVGEFRLESADLAAGQEWSPSGDGRPRILLCVAGSAIAGGAADGARDDAAALELTPGAAAWVPAADDAPQVVAGDAGATVFAATTGRPSG